MTIHVAPGGVRLGGHIFMGIKLGKELLEGKLVERHHPGLVAVITGAPVPLVEGMGNGELNQLFAVAKDAEFGFSGEHLTPGDDGCLAGAHGEAVIGDQLFWGKRKCVWRFHFTSKYE